MTLYLMRLHLLFVISISGGDYIVVRCADVESRTKIGRMAERLNAAVSKTVIPQGIAGSNPAPSARKNRIWGSGIRE